MPFSTTSVKQKTFLCLWQNLFSNRHCLYLEKTHRTTGINCFVCNCSCLRQCRHLFVKEMNEAQGLLLACFVQLSTFFSSSLSSILFSFSVCLASLGYKQSSGTCSCMHYVSSFKYQQVVFPFCTRMTLDFLSSHLIISQEKQSHSLS